MITILAKTYKTAMVELGSLDIVKFNSSRMRGSLKTESGVEDFRIATERSEPRGFGCDRIMVLGPPVSDWLMHLAECGMPQA